METSQSAVLMRPLQIFTTGKSIEIDRRSWAQGLFEVSALSVVVNAQADAQAYQLDGGVMAHHGDDG